MTQPQPLPPAAFIAGMVAQGVAGVYWRGTVTGTSGNKVIVQKQVQAGTETVTCARLASYSSPQESDEVLGVNLLDGSGGESPLVLGKIAR